MAGDASVVHLGDGRGFTVAAEQMDPHELDPVTIPLLSVADKGREVTKKDHRSCRRVSGGVAHVAVPTRHRASWL